MNFFAAACLLIAVGAITCGAALIYLPAGLIVGGLFLGAVGVLSIKVAKE